MTFGAGSGVWGDIAGVDRNRGTRLVAMAVERGVNLIDTADVYSQGRSEEVVGRVLKALRLSTSGSRRSKRRSSSARWAANWPTA
ncbi:aldo/keto reductase [Burkholderia multivorans]|uniref:aldo/keto reductase n=1 Tax=Burkholderia multivorans TaxID=87883 RepID=UPI00350F70A4